MIWAEIALWLICGGCIAVGLYKAKVIIIQAMEAEEKRNEP